MDKLFDYQCLSKNKRMILENYINKFIQDIIFKYDELPKPISIQSTRIYQPNLINKNEFDTHLIKWILEMLFPSSEFYTKLSYGVETWFLTFSKKDLCKLKSMNVHGGNSF